ncbi:MAG: sensor histidine kinase [Thermoplasmatota archaeon]
MPLQAVLDSAPDALLLIDANREIVFVNRRAQEMYGYPFAELVGKAASVLTSPRGEAAMAGLRGTLDRSAVLKGRIAVESWGLRKNATEFPTEVTVSQIEDQPLFLAAVRDVTARHAAEANLRRLETELRASRDLLSSAERSAQYGSFEIDVPTMGIRISDGFKAAFGLPPESDKKLEELTGMVVEEDRQAAFDVTRTALTNVGTVYFAYRLRRADGVVRAFDVTMQTVAGPDGAPGRVVGIARDITDQKKAEATLARTAIELEAANKELEAFAYSVSHDLRAPLRSMSGFAQILLEEFSDKLPPEARHDVEMIVESAREMGQLVDDLLHFSRLSKQPLALHQAHPADVARRALDDLLAGEPKERNVHTRLGAMPPCQADPALLRQVYVNLLSNALKYTRKRDPAEIEVGWTPAEGGAYFVKDNGVGFDMAHADTLFGVFQRLHRAEEYEGTGVGLAIVQRIVSRHGGRVWATAALDQGATFHFTLGGTPHG